MKNHLQISISLLLLMEAGHMTQATFVQNIYKKTEPGRNITGKVGAEIRVQSEMECSRKCRGTKKCEAYKYQGTRPGNCILIQSNCSNIDGPMFEQEKDDVIFEKVDSSAWTEPRCWNGPKAALYYNFDSSHGFVLMEGSQEANQFPLVTGKIGSAWSLDKTKSQWVDLGIHTEACMTHPETCGAAGGAISLWVNVIDCPDWSGIITSYASSLTCSTIFCFGNYISVLTDVIDGRFASGSFLPTGWTHVVLNYIGPNDGEGIMMFIDGIQWKNDTSKSEGRRSPGDGRIVVGRFYTDRNQNHDYASQQVDELIFFNEALSTSDIKLLYHGI